MYSKRYRTNKLTYALVFIVMIALGVGSVFAILSQFGTEEKINSNNQLASTESKTSETGIILSILACVACLILAFVISSLFYMCDSRRTK